MQTKNLESSIEFRFANCYDAKQLAKLHYLCSQAQPGGFMFKLGRRFFLEYYRILLRERTTVVLCADAGRDGIVGLISASTDVKKEIEALRKGRYKLLLAALPNLIRQPSLIRTVISREKSLSPTSMGEGFIVGSGARLTFWGWLPNYPSKGHSVRLLKAILKILGTLGISSVQLEVDRVNRNVEVVYRLLGAKVVKEFTTKDGRQRMVMEHNLTTQGA
jgi:hypothetical protein